MKKYIYILAAITLISSCGSADEPEMSDAELDAKVDAEVERQIEQQEMELMKDDFKWSYQTEKDEMTDNSIYIAHITSQDEVELEFPYEGGTYLTLWIRKNANKSEAYITSSNGQLYDDINEPVINVRFDQEQPMNFGVLESADNDPTIRFISSADKFISKMKTAKKVKIEVQYYENGKHVYQFNTKGFDWKH